MLCRYQPRALALVGIAAAFVMLAVAVIGASSASAGGPVWNVTSCEKTPGFYLVRSVEGKCEARDNNPEGEFEKVLHELVAGTKVNIVSSGGTFILKGLANIVCKSERDSGELIGGNPGTDLSVIEFFECAVEGKTVAECGASNVTGKPGSVLTEVKTVLVYPHEKPETKEEALDAFLPDETGNLFVEFTLTGTNCALLNNVKVDVNATGTEIKDPALNKKCGVLARVGKLEGGIFAVTVAEEEALVGALNSEGKPEEATLWKPLAKVFENIVCKLEAFGAAATEIGISDITLTTGEEFGWG